MSKKEVFIGNRYNFRISLSPLNKKQSSFAIIARHNDTKTISFITTVNVILSALEVSSDMSCFWESEWVLSREKANELAVSAGKIFSDNKFLSFVESCLDLDREQSSWENKADYERL